MVIYLAAMQNISESLYEAASIDGATRLKQLFTITIPQLKPVILFTAILSTIGTLQLFDEPYLLTKGGPSDATLTIGMICIRRASAVTISATHRHLLTHRCTDCYSFIYSIQSIGG